MIAAKKIRVVLPQHLRTLATVDREITVAVSGSVTMRSVLEAIEKNYPVLDGAIRDHLTRERRPLVRFFACGEDISHEALELTLPANIASGVEPFIILGAIAGG